MTKELEAFERIKRHPEIYWGLNGKHSYLQDLDIIETALKENESLKTDLLGLSQELLMKNKALEIIKKKKVNTYSFYISKNAEIYNTFEVRHNGGEYEKVIPITQEEYDLLREVLL